jgi:hypothetical protein
MDYRIECTINPYPANQQYFQIDVTFTSNKRSRQSSNVRIACRRLREGQLLSLDVFDNRYDFAWHFVPASEQDGISDSKFDVYDIKIDGVPIDVSRESSTTDEIIFSTDEISIKEDSVIEYNISVLQSTATGGVSFGISRPVKSFTAELSYEKMAIKDVNVWSYIGGDGSVVPSIRRNKEQKKIAIRYIGWLMVGNGIVFSWVRPENWHRDKSAWRATTENG